MKILTSPSDHVSEMRRLMTTYSEYRWSVAWGGVGFEGFDLLRKNAGKIRQIVFGLDFYQTHPDLMKEFIGSKTVRFIQSSKGVFHPKVYLFSNGKGEWESIVGSANFTNSGFNVNREAGVLIGGDDFGSVAAYKSLKKSIEIHWREARSVTQPDFDKYSAEWKSSEPFMRTLEVEEGPKEEGEVSEALPVIESFEIDYDQEWLEKAGGGVAIRKRYLYLFPEKHKDFSLDAECLDGKVLQIETHIAGRDVGGSFTKGMKPWFQYNKIQLGSVFIIDVIEKGKHYRIRLKR